MKKISFDEMFTDLVKVTEIVGNIYDNEIRALRELNNTLKYMNAMYEERKLQRRGTI